MILGSRWWFQNPCDGWLINRDPYIGLLPFFFLGDGNSNMFYVHPYLGTIPILTDIFSTGLKPRTRKAIAP